MSRVLELVAPQTLRLAERRVPALPSDHVRCRVGTVGICGTDVHLWRDPGGLALPHVLGHDFCATVVEVGADVGHGALAVGTRVTGDPVEGCRACPACADGHPHLCPHTTYMGITAPGCFADDLVLPADRVVPVPSGLSDDAVALLEPVAVALHVRDRRAHMGPRRVVVVGCGPVGLVAGRMLASPGEWVGIDPRTERQALATRWGATAGLSPDDADAVTEWVGEEPVLFVECSAAADAPAWCTRHAAPGSVIAVVASSPQGYPAADILRKELDVLGIRGGLDYATATAVAGELPLAELVTRRLPLADGQEAFELLSEGGSATRLHLDLHLDRPATHRPSGE